MANVEPQIPERVQDGLDDTLLGRGDRAVDDYEQIDVGVEAQMTPAVTSDRDQREPMARRLVGGLVNVADDAVDPVGIAGGRRQPGVRLPRLGPQLVTRGGEDLGERRFGRRRGRGCGTMCGHECGHGLAAGRYQDALGCQGTSGFRGIQYPTLKPKKPIGWYLSPPWSASR